MGFLAALKGLVGPGSHPRPYEPNEPLDEEHQPFMDEESVPTPKFMKMGTFRLTKAVIRLHWLCFFFGIGASVWGYNIGILSSILVHPGWREVQNNPPPSVRGIITATYYLGTWISYVFISRPLSDTLGRRYGAMCGTFILAIGAALQAGCTGSHAFAMMVSGRIICGMGVAILSTSVPLYQSEISPAKQRGKFVTMNHIGFVAGLAGGLWIGYGMTFWTSPAGVYYGWRVSILLQMVPAFTFAAGLPFLPESPRWLVEKGRIDQASRVLHWLREGSFTAAEITHELTDMQRSVEAHRHSGHTWRSLFTERALFARLWRAALLHFMAQMCGATAMKYYLPALLEALGLSTRIALMAGAIEMTLKIGMTVVEMLIIDRLGRRVTLVLGCTAMAIGMLLNGALPLAYPNNVNKAADMVCVIFIFIYAFGYSMGFGPAAWVYGSEIFPTSVRARGLNFAASGGSIGSIVVAQVWPVGIHNIGSKIYFFFMAVNLICIPIIYLLYPETKGRALEDMDELFGKIKLGVPAVDHADVEDEDEDHLASPKGGARDAARVV